MPSFFTDLHGIGLVDYVVASFGVLTHHYEINANGIIQALFVYNVAHGEFGVAHQVAAVEVVAKL